MNTIEEIASVLKNTKSAMIFTHVRPDGDTLGSGMALHRALSLLGVQSEVLNEGEIPATFSFLPGMDEIVRKPSFPAEIHIAVDTSDVARLGQLETAFRTGRKTTVNIDHHISNTRFAKYNFVRERASNCENIMELIGAMGLGITGDIASFLMLGMVTDSGGFSHSDVDGDTLRAAATARDGGADLHQIVYETMRRRSKPRAELYAETVSRLRYFLGDTLAVAVVPHAALEERGLGTEATEGIVDFALTVDCVEVSVCLLEMKRGQYKVSLRSKGKVDVNAIAKMFGGGGHTLASGCMLFGDPEEIMDRLRYAVYQHSGDL